MQPVVGQAGSQGVAQQQVLLRQRVEQFPSDHQAWHALGLMHFNEGRLEQAIQCLEKAVGAGPSIALYHRNLGEMYRRLGHLKPAIRAGERATLLGPRDVDAHYNLGLAYTDAKEFDKAQKAYRAAIKLKPNHNLSWNNLGSALEQMGDKAGALAAYQKAVSIDPRHAEAQNNAGAIYSEQGHLDQAREAFESAVSARPAFVEAHYNLSSLKKYQPDDPHLKTLQAIYDKRTGLSTSARIRYDFALGKALDDIGAYDRAFEAYEEGNALQHGLLPMDEAKADAMLEAIVATFDEGFFAKRQSWQGCADPTRTPIFIVGMPRSGTTLLEQVLCSHPSVYGAGELIDLNAVVMQATNVNAKANANGHEPFTDGITVLSETAVKQIGQAYLNRVWALSPESTFITDKMPANFFYLGIIHLALPHAKIIHAMRDPMDSCFSCYSRLFNDTMEFAYDQGTLGRYYARYMKLMAHWHRVLPKGTILDLPYEQMVEDTEGQARRVLEYVGLDWDPACLEFYKNDRLVKTASVAQVRKPIYRTSVARWRHFAKHLTPLLSLVRDYREMTAEDEALLAEAPPVERKPVVAVPEHTAESLHMQGIALYRADRFAEAVALFDRALGIRPDFPGCLNSKGFALQDMGRMPEALAAFAKAVELAPEMDMARLNLAMAQLKLGDWANGWENYESRWTGSAEANAGKLAKPACPLPVWRGETDTEGKRLLVVTEQGFGDTFQFVRYLPLLANRFAKVGFACSQPTQRLMEWSFSEQVMTMVQMPDATEGFDTWDWQCPIMSLPRAFGTRLESIPADVPYLKVPQTAVNHWRERLELAAPKRLRIGIAWAGRKVHQYDQRRSMAFEQLLPLLKDDRITWVSLQKWAPEEQRPEIPVQVDWIDWTESLSDFGDTAALVGNLDLVISIDSSMVHLAGALNRPVWMLDRFDSEWRWLCDRTDSPWYPNLRIFRQPEFGQWDAVLASVKEALAPMVMGRARMTKPRKPKNVVTKPAVTRPSAAVPGNQSIQPANALTPKAALELAAQLQNAGRLHEAEQLLLQVLNAEPRNAHAMHLLGVVYYQAGQHAVGMQRILTAIEYDDQVPLFYSNLAEMSRQQGDVAAAIKFGERAVALDGSMASAQSNLGIAYYDAKDYERAQACHERALEISSGLLQSLNNLGSIARARKDKDQAAAWYRKALDLQPDYLESLSNLGAVLVEDDQADEASPYLERALQLQANYPEALCNLGLVRLKQERTDESIALLQRCLQLKSGYPEALVGLGRALREKDALDEAKQMVLQATERAPDKADAWCQLGSICTELSESDEAQRAFLQALKLDPEMVDALTGLGNLRLEQGEIDESVRLFEQAIANDPDNLGARFHLTQAKKVKPGDDNLAALEQAAETNKDLKEERQISLHYALGKAYDDLKEWDKAFPHFMQGASIKRKKLDYSADAESARIDRLIDVVNAEFIERLKGAGNPTDVPVFVLGMPRSGTTLTEQIMASHRDVHGAGELRHLMTVIQQQPGGGPFVAFPDNLTDLDHATLTQWGTDYLNLLRGHHGTAARITDKMPANYLGLGLIHLALPGAKVVHVKRNPVDTCISCFTRLFNRHQDATYDLHELGRHYANYARLMDHWRKVLPPGAFLEVQYEDIVADQEAQARRLIDWIGLDWDEACIEFHKTKRNVRTASVTQVRQPIYTTSVERWRNYEKFLQPLFDGLGDAAPAR